MTAPFKTAAAFLIAPLATPLFFIAAAAARGAGFGLRQVFALFLLYAFFAYLTVLVFGVPAYILYRALGLTNPALYAVGGGLIGVVVSLFFVSVVDYDGVFDLGARARVWFALPGALSALVFRLLLPDDGAAADRLP